MKYYSICVVLLSCYYGSAIACTFNTTTEFMWCTNVQEISTEGSNMWNKLFLYNSEIVLPLRTDSFKSAPNLREIKLDNIFSIEEGSFNGLTRLHNLGVYNSELEEIPVGVLSNLPIRKLIVESTSLTHIQPGFFKDLPDIKEVRLDDNNIQEIKKGTFDNTGIEVLDVKNNKYLKISGKAFENMHNLINLDLEGNELNSFSSELYLGSNNSLEALWLTKNKLTNITKNMFTTIHYLKYLFLHLNQIETIESGSFYQLPNLQELDISNNKLRQIQPNIFKASGIKSFNYLAVHNNKLSYMNTTVFHRIPNLEYISYAGNPFQCSCYQQLGALMRERNITRICDKDYLQGQRPTCVFSSSSPNKCLYDEDVDELYKLYQEALQGYGSLKPICETGDGYDNAYLTDL